MESVTTLVREIKELLAVLSNMSTGSVLFLCLIVLAGIFARYKKWAEARELKLATQNENIGRIIKATQKDLINSISDGRKNLSIAMARGIARELDALSKKGGNKK